MPGELDKVELEGNFLCDYLSINWKTEPINYSIAILVVMCLMLPLQ